MSDISILLIKELGEEIWTLKSGISTMLLGTSGMAGEDRISRVLSLDFVKRESAPSLCRFVACTMMRDLSAESFEDEDECLNRW